MSHFPNCPTIDVDDVDANNRELRIIELQLITIVAHKLDSRCLAACDGLSGDIAKAVGSFEIRHSRA